MKATDKDQEVYGIKFRVHKKDKDNFLLYPVCLVKGHNYDDCFMTKTEIISYADRKTNFKNKYVVDLVYTKDELKKMYNYDDDDEEFLTKFFYEDNSNMIYIVKTEGEYDISKVSFDYRKIADQSCDAVYCMDESYPAVILNEKALDEIMKCKDDKEREIIIRRYRSDVKKFKYLNDTTKTSKIYVSDGKVNYIETLKKLPVKDMYKEVEISTKKKEKQEEPVIDKDAVSYNGLRNYIKERVYGHDEEIDLIAQKIFMNYTAEGDEPTESILLVGPTGTGKTQTVHTACEYLNLPFVEMNTSNMVPQGIKGINIEDLIIRLYEMAERDLARAEKGIVFLDEFDKVDEITPDFREAIKNILLTFNDGGKIIIEKDNHSFTYNAARATKIYAGVFQKITETIRSMGFNTALEDEKSLATEQEIRKEIINKEYFTNEDLSRITKIIKFDELSREAKKKALLGSKIGEFYKKQARYKRQFGIDMIADETYVDAILDTLDKDSQGMRNLNNYVSGTIDKIERKILEGEVPKNKQLVLTKETAYNSNNFIVN